MATKTSMWMCWIIALIVLGMVTGCESEHPDVKTARAVISGNSMAPHFLGKHQSTVCRGCKSTILSEVTAASDSIVCPNCGLACNMENKFQTQPADKVSLVLEKSPQRWQVIGFQRSNDDQASIKRVIGLPGETVWFEHGNVFLQTIGGEAKLLKKNWPQQQATRVLVHDNRFQDDHPRRWSPLEPTSPLIASVPKKFQTPEYSWFNFQPKRCYDHLSVQPWSPQIEDSYGFNQTISRSLNRVDEVCLEFKFDLNSKCIQAGKSELLVAIIVGQQTHLAQFVLNRNWVDVQLFDRDQQTSEVIRCPINADSPTCSVSNIDSQIIVAVGEQQVQLLDLISQQADLSVDLNSSAELLISFQPPTFENLKQLRLYRDLYYFSPLSRDELIKRQSGKGLAGTEGYFVVGDNLPVSWDSRRWLLPRVGTEDIIGIVDIGQSTSD